MCDFSRKKNTVVDFFLKFPFPFSLFFLIDCSHTWRKRYSPKKKKKMKLNPNPLFQNVIKELHFPKQPCRKMPSAGGVNHLCLISMRSHLQRRKEESSTLWR